MSDLPRSRKRAVRLTPEALEALRSALARRWQSDGGGERLTREVRAELLGVSVATAGRILTGGGADRATLALAYRNLGLDWNDSLCEPLPQEPEPIADDRTTSPPAPPVEPTPAAPPRASARRPYALRTAFLCLGVAIAVWAALSAQAYHAQRAWGFAFNDAFEEGLRRFHQADYAGVHAPLARALAIAKEHDSAEKLASALRLAGDLAGAEGRLPESRDDYAEALHLRDRLAQEVTKPPLYEALGDVETRLGEVAAAKESLSRSLEGYRRFDDPTGIAMASRDLGALALRTGELDAADRWFRQSIDALGGKPDPDIVCDVRGQRALILLERGRAAEARQTLRGCLDYWTRRGHARWVAVCEFRLGLVEDRLGHVAAASALLNRSRQGFERVGDRAGAHEATSHLSLLAAKPRKAT